MNVNKNTITLKSFDVTEEAKQACENKNECVFVGSNANAGDPCVGFGKYTRVQFSCNGVVLISSGTVQYIVINSV